jgi:hypothetical protein
VEGNRQLDGWERGIVIGGASADVDVASAKGRWFQSDLRTVRIVSDNLSGVNGFSRHAWKPGVEYVRAIFEH